jgi:hypothetical protein
VVATRPTYLVASYVEGSRGFPFDQPHLASYTSFSVFATRPKAATRASVFSSMVWVKLSAESHEFAFLLKMTIACL